MLNALDVAIGFATVMLAVSLIIMALTQAVASLFALRGSRLRLGLEQLLGQAVPSLKDKAKAVSLAMVTHPLISDSAVGGRLRWNWASTIKREELIPVLTQVLAQQGLPPLAEAQKAALEQWFDAFMRRVSQWFTMNTRWITVAFACVIAVAMHLDSIRVIRQLETDSETRARLSAMSASLLDQTPEATHALETAIHQAIASVYSANPQAFATVFPAGPSDGGLRAVTSDATARLWIAAHARADAAEDLQQKLGVALQAALAPALSAAINRANTLESQLSSAGIDLIAAGHGLADLDPRRDPSHLLGVLASVLFLSLGAPFWFNVLKSVTSLKSAVAKVQEQPAAEESPVVVPVRTAAPPASAGERGLRGAQPAPAEPPMSPPAVGLPMVVAVARPAATRLPDLP